jgi:hypothetical protein
MIGIGFLIDQEEILFMTSLPGRSRPRRGRSSGGGLCRDDRDAVAFVQETGTLYDHPRASLDAGDGGALVVAAGATGEAAVRDAVDRLRHATTAQVVAVLNRAG